MSDYERNKGKLIPTTKSIDELFEELGGTEKDLEIYTKESYVREYCQESGYENINDKFYTVEFEIKADTSYPEFAEVGVNEDGSINFHTYHYNGGAHYTEVIADALNMLK